MGKTHMPSGYDIPAEYAGRARIGTCSWKYVNVNNHYEGSGPLTIQRLLDLLRPLN
jgi:hypothetical protein